MHVKYLIPVGLYGPEYLNPLRVLPFSGDRRAAETGEAVVTLAEVVAIACNLGALSALKTSKCICAQCDHTLNQAHSEQKFYCTLDLSTNPTPCC